MAVISLEANQFEKTVLEAGKPVVVKFSAPWCGYCRRLAPAIGRLEQEIGDKVVFADLNVDEAQNWMEKYEVDTLPTLILFQNGKPGGPLINPPSSSAVKSWLEEQGVL